MAGCPKGLDDAALRDRVAQATVGYFTHWSHPRSGMARERSGGAAAYDIEDTVTTGGTGFGLMAQIVAAERGWQRLRDFEDRLERLLGFLERADRFAGVFPHFLSGSTGRVIAFSAGDDGGDLVETAFLMTGLLCAASYLGDAHPLSARVEGLWQAVDWSSHLRAADNALMWHRHPDRPWTRASLPIRGWNEALPVFILAAGSPSHAIPASVYHESWARAPQFRNGRSYHGIHLPLGPAQGGPLFLSHYPFLGLDPRGLADAYADYSVQARAHALINRAHCVANPRRWRGYGADCWGLTSSDSPRGYLAHAPDCDTGTIAPTAALSSLPFCAAETMPVLRRLHDDLGERLFGEGGFVDAFSPHLDWVADSRIAINQGPIVVALENYRSGLLWRLFMCRPEVRRGLASLGFSQAQRRAAIA